MKKLIPATTVAFLLMPMIFLSARAVRTNSVYAQGAGNCAENWIAKDEEAPFSYSGDQIIDTVMVKAGSEQSTGGGQCTTLTIENPSNTCFEVIGLGTTNVTVNQLSTTGECKEISHVEFYFFGSSATPSSTPTATPTTDPSATPTPTPTDDPEVTPSPTPTDEATPTPTSTSTPTSAPRPTPAPKDAGEVDYPKNSDPGSVLGVSTTGQVLGASTMAATGSATQDFGMLLVVLGVISAYVSAKAYQKVQ